MIALLWVLAVGTLAWALFPSSSLFKDIEKERIEVKNAECRYWFDPEIKSSKEKHIIDKCRSFLDESICNHVSIDGSNNTVYLYWDEVMMNDDIISKLQDTLTSKGWNVEIVYNSIINEINKGE